jgi:hypothetical protein
MIGIERKNGIKQCHSSTEAWKTIESQWTIQKHWRDKTEVRQQRHRMQEGLGLKCVIKQIKVIKCQKATTSICQ